ncbi:hypothetical protein Dxin01_03687 [Deinococcus xinjiangensis]|uniref:DUF4115 domain-containing protein n=1 Tax=Deinococcus xinjiangensis TaxID=457454 RepID=A0ABP9VFB1_9DEIO
MLQQARLERGLSLQEVSANTHIRLDYLQALEAENLAALPERTFARSFLSQYARELGLEPAPLLEELDRALPAPTKATYTHYAQPPRQSSFGALLPVLLGGLLLLGGVGYFVTRNQSAQTAAKPTPAPETPVPVSVNLTVNSLPTGARVFLDNRELGRTPVQSFPVEARKGAVLRVEYGGRLSFKQQVDLRTGRNLRVRLMPVGLGPSVMTDVATGSVQESLPVPPPAAPPVTVKGVTLRFSGDSWLRVTGAGGRLLFEGIVPAGTVKTYDRGITVRAGNAAAVRVSVDGSDPVAMGSAGQAVTQSY